MGLNFQDVIRDVHDPANHALNISGTISAAGQATVTLVSTPTLYAVVNTSAAGQASVVVDRGHSFIGLTTTVVSSVPTIFAVVNTSAAGQASVVVDGPVAIKGNVTLSDAKTYIGLVSVSTKLDETIYTDGTGTVSKGIAIFGQDGTNPQAIKTDSTGVIQAEILSGNIDVDSVAGTVAVTQSGTWDEVGINDSGNSITVDGTFWQATQPVSWAGNVTLSDAKTFIGLTTTTLGASPAFVGIVTVANPSSFSGNVTLDPGSFTGIKGNITINSGTITAVTDITNPVAIKGNMTLSDSKTFIGLTTTVIASAPTIFAVVNTSAAGQASVVVDGPVAIKGNITIDSGTITAVTDITNPVAIKGNMTLSDSKGFIGLVSIGGGVLNTITAVTDITNPVAHKGNMTLSDAKTYIGLVTATSINGGTNKSLINLPIGFSASSIVTIAVPTNANSIKITNMIINSNATVRLAMKSGVTYLLGNASIGITLNPGGGFPLTGSPDSPSWIGLPSGALVIEKLDLTGTAAALGGNVVYFQE